MKRHNRAISTTMATLALIAECGYAVDPDRFPRPKPTGYKTHIPKSERKGKTAEELRAMREG